MFQKGNTMRQDGFTMIELLCVLAIIAILLAAALPYLMGDRAHGMEIGIPTIATDENITSVAKAVKSDPAQTLTVLVYAAKWTIDDVDDLMDKARVVQRKLVNHGININRIHLHLANEQGLLEDATSAPDSNGVYISID